MGWRIDREILAQDNSVRVQPHEQKMNDLINKMEIKKVLFRQARNSKYPIIFWKLFYDLKIDKTRHLKK